MLRPLVRTRSKSSRASSPRSSHAAHRRPPTRLRIDRGTMPESAHPPQPPEPQRSVTATAPTMSELTRLTLGFQEAARLLNRHFLDKQEIVRLMVISCIAGEHMIIIGPPGTAKSALVRLL